MKKPLAIDLFCGAGGMSEGILQAGFHIVFSNDKSPEVALTYQNRHEQLGLKHGYNTFFITEDISKLTGHFILDSIAKLEYFKNNFDRKIDVIFGGPPCQGFSRAGKRKQDDPRNFLFREYLRVVSEIQPNYVVVENVLGLLDTKLTNFVSYDSEKYPENSFVTKILEKEFFKLGYHIKKYNSEKSVNFKKLILDASDFGVPQKRERVIIVAYKNGTSEPRDISEYKKNYKVTVKEAIADLITNKQLREKELKKLKESNKMTYIKQSIMGRTPNIKNEFLFNLEKNIQNTDVSMHAKYVVERFSLYENGESSKDVKERLALTGIEDTKTIPHLLKYMLNAMKSNEYTYELLEKDLKNLPLLCEKQRNELLDLLLSKKNIRVRVNKDTPSRTIVTLPDDYISPFENRTFSVREMARLQSFDDSFIFLGKRTTGGKRRKVEVPQYTQVGNAVPPLLAKAVAMSIMDVISKEKKSS